MATPCDGRNFSDFKNCTQCKYGLNATRARQQCPTGSFLVDECSTGRNPFDNAQCSSCSSICKGANYSIGENGQYIAEICKSGETQHTCGNCDGPCAPYENMLNPGAPSSMLAPLNTLTFIDFAIALPLTNTEAERAS
jgi:hypothetical protein